MKLGAQAKAFRKPNTRTMKKGSRSVISARKYSPVPFLILQTLHLFFRKKIWRARRCSTTVHGMREFPVIFLTNPGIYLFDAGWHGWSKFEGVMIASLPSAHGRVQTVYVSDDIVIENCVNRHPDLRISGSPDFLERRNSTRWARWSPGQEETSP